MSDFDLDYVKRVSCSNFDEDTNRELLEAFDGFGALFTADWIRANFQNPVTGAEQNIAQEAIRILCAWRDWIQVRNLRNADRVRKVWSEGFWADGILSEIHVCAACTRAGIACSFYPQLSNGKEPDILCETNPPLHIEVASRRLSDVQKKYFHWLQVISNALLNKFPGESLRIGFTNELTEEAVQEVLQLVETSADVPITLLDSVLHRGTRDEVRGLEPRINNELGNDVQWTCAFRMGSTRNQLVYCGAKAPSAEVGRIIDAEAKQLPKGIGPCVIALDASGALNEKSLLKQAVARRLQPAVNTRVTEVWLVDAWPKPTGYSGAVHRIANPHNGFQLPHLAVDAISNLAIPV